MSSRIKKCKPLDLLVPERLDLVVKYLYIIAKQESQNFEYYKNLYLKHIEKRTGGKQYIYEYKKGKPTPQGEKLNLDDYLYYFDKLINSFTVNGFKSEFFIPISSLNGILLDGAHRAACSIYFTEAPFIKKEERNGRSWDYKWFINNDFNDEELNDILNTYLKLKKNHIFVCILWSPVEDYWNDIETDVANNSKIVFSKDYTFHRDSFNQVVNDVYSYEFGTILPKKIEKKIEVLSRYTPKIRFILFELDKPKYLERGSDKLCIQVSNMKTSVRDKWDSLVRKEMFVTLHASDNISHTDYIRRIFMSSNNLRIMNQRRDRTYRITFLNWLEEYKRIIESYDISQDDCCIVGSGPMEVLGIRDSTDIDFILITKVRDRLFSEKSKSLSENVDLVHKGYHEYNNDCNPISDNDIIMNPNYHFYFRGLKFANIEIIQERKKNHKREKDVIDTGLIDNFMRRLDK